MTTSEVELLAGKLDKIDERLRKMEEELAERRGADAARSMTRGQVVAWVMGIAAVVGAASAAASQLIDRL